jgi:hypothetical protein
MCRSRPSNRLSVLSKAADKVFECGHPPAELLLNGGNGAMPPKSSGCPGALNALAQGCPMLFVAWTGIADRVGGLLPNLPQRLKLLIDLLRTFEADPGSDRWAALCHGYRFV